MTLELQLSSDAQTLNILVLGGLDHRAWTHFQRLGHPPFDQVKHIVIDMKCADRLDGIALGLLRYIFRQASERQIHFVIRHSSPSIQAILKMSGLPQSLEGRSDTYPDSQLG